MVGLASLVVGYLCLGFLVEQYQSDLYLEESQ